MNGVITCSVKEAAKLMEHLNEDDLITLTIIDKKSHIIHNQPKRIKKKNGENLIDNADSIFQGIGPKEPGTGLKEAMIRSKINDSWDVYKRDSKEDIYTYKGRMVRFYIKNIGTNKQGKDLSENK